MITSLGSSVGDASQESGARQSVGRQGADRIGAVGPVGRLQPAMAQVLGGDAPAQVDLGRVS